MGKSNKENLKPEKKKRGGFFANLADVWKSSKNDDAATKKAKRNKRLLCIVACAVLFLALSWLVTELGQLEKVEYATFLEQVKNGKIDEIEVDRGSGEIRYKTDAGSYRTNYPYTDTFIETMLLSGVNVEYYSNFKVMDYLPSPVSIALIVFMLVFIKRMGSQFGANEGFYKNVTKNPPSKASSFADVAGMDEIKEDMRSLAEIVKDKKYKERGVAVPKGVLLDGPPGNGKTLLARAFAGECGLNFIALNASDFGSPFVGIASQKINQAFKDAREMAPCVIFIDEIDAVGSKRTAAGSGAEKEFNSTLTTLLGNMDGFTSADDILVMAATNRAEDLDDALVRPGRFDRKFTIGLPDKKTRYELFKLYTKNVPVDENLNFDNLVSQTYGCSSAKVKGIVNEALISSVKNQREVVTEEDFSQAIVRMTLNGLEKKSTRWEGKTKNLVAYHEAGHAVVAHLLGKRVSSVSIIPTTGSAGGYTMFDDGDRELMSLSDYRKMIKTLYGGKAAESVLMKNPNSISVGASQDIKEATRIATAIANFADGVDYSEFGERGREIVTEKAMTELNNMWEECLAMVVANWDTVTRVAEALKSKEKMTAEEFLEIAQPSVTE